MPKSSSYILFYRTNSNGSRSFYITYNYGTIRSNPHDWNSDYIVRFIKPDGTEKTYTEVSGEIEAIKTAINAQYGIPKDSIYPKLSLSGYACRFVTDLTMSPNFYNLVGGGEEAGDAGPLDTAVREAHEELGLPIAAMTTLLTDESVTTTVTSGLRTVYIVDTDKPAASAIRTSLVEIHPTVWVDRPFPGGTITFISAASEIITANWYTHAVLIANLGKFSFALSRV